VKYVTTYGFMVVVDMGFRLRRRISRLLAQKLVDEHVAIEGKVTSMLESADDAVGAGEEEPYYHD
jgi:hypothetical protein